MRFILVVRAKTENYEFEFIPAESFTGHYIMNAIQSVLDQLNSGNKRFVAGEGLNGDVSPQRRLQLTDGQSPKAVVVGCADSRVPVELIFDQGLGELFVIRVAGNIVDESVLGSVEFAVSHLGCKLVIVLGHSSCGAVKATLHEVNQPSGDLSPSLRSIVNAIEPAVRSLMTHSTELTEENLTEQAIQSNVRQSLLQIYQKSQGIQSAVNDRNLSIVGAIYDLETGTVKWIDRIPQ